MRRVTSPHTVGDAIEALHVSPTTSQHSIEGPTSLEVAMRRLISVDFLTVTPEVIGMRSARTVAPPT